MQVLAHAATPIVPVSTTRRWAGRGISALAGLFLVVDGAIKALLLAPAVETTAQLGYPERLTLGLGLLELACLAVYVLPRTTLLGGVLLTGYLGGAVATHVRVGNPLFSHVLFPTYVAALVWGGLYLRDARVRALIGASRG